MTLVQIQPLNNMWRGLKIMKIFDPRFSPYYFLILSASEKLRKATISCVISVRVSIAGNRSVLVGLIFMEFDI